MSVEQQISMYYKNEFTILRDDLKRNKPSLIIGIKCRIKSLINIRRLTNEEPKIGYFMTFFLIKFRYQIKSKPSIHVSVHLADIMSHIYEIYMLVF